MARKSKNVLEAEDFLELVDRTDKENPRPEDMKAIKAILDEQDYRSEALTKANESVERVFALSAELRTPSGLGRELYSREVTAKRKEMNYDSADRMVQMLIDNVIACQMALCHSQLTYVANLSDGGISWYAANYYNKSVTEHQKRFNRACLALAKVRKLLSESEYYEQKSQRARRGGAKHAMDVYARLSK